MKKALNEDYKDMYIGEISTFAGLRMAANKDNEAIGMLHERFHCYGLGNNDADEIKLGLANMIAEGALERAALTQEDYEKFHDKLYKTSWKLSTHGFTDIMPAHREGVDYRIVLDDPNSRAPARKMYSLFRPEAIGRIKETLARMNRIKYYYSKMDVIAAFSGIRVKVGNEQ
ncbi:hypothetical protein GQ43DRAFT_474779 [Delitschia confertaspora ATCC 74209]|uniref:Uncharacterized protein n=1 Tax=Delitschia confertaspora ATCC 74209 TaxID=1513339 RepID=A0A9P4JK50_9PLEO|nr:hypothetical protein GQ43DRAFT_474779 [Delitschia confertaspora ATCC 74209]